jgi:hypothetical protein
MRRVLPFIAVVGMCVLLAASASTVRGDIILYDTTSGALHDNSGFPAAPQLDDAQFAVPSGATINAMDFAYWYRIDPFDPPVNPQPEDVDALVTFWDNMNTAASGPTTVNTTSLGTFRRHIGVIAPDTTGFVGQFSVPTPIVAPDNKVGVQINWVLTGTNTISDVVTRIATDLPTVGTTVDKYWNDDQNPGGSFQGQDAVLPNPGTPAVHENMALKLVGNVPEPTSLSLLIPAAAAGLSARRRRKATGYRP